MNRLFLLKGISATGKGTRVSQLLEFLKTKFAYSSIYVTKVNIDGTEFKIQPFQLSVSVPHLNLIFIGRWVRSNKSKLISWSSLDNLSKFNEPFYKYIVEYFGSRKFDLICEGYFGGKSSALIPEYASQFFDSANVTHYYYDNMEELQLRVEGRSGSRIKGTCYNDNRRYTKEESRVLDYQRYLGKWPSSSYEFKRFDSPISDFGSLLLESINENGLRTEFLEYCERETTHRKVGTEQDSKYVGYLTKECEESTSIEIIIDSTKQHLLDLTGNIICGPLA